MKCRLRAKQNKTKTDTIKTWNHFLLPCVVSLVLEAVNVRVRFFTLPNAGFLN